MFNKKKESIQLPKVEVEQRYVDKIWGDTILKIVAISKDNTQCRYIFECIEGKNMLETLYYTPSTHTTAAQFILDNYELIPK